MGDMPFLGQDPGIPPLAPEPAPAPSIEPDVVETQNFNTGLMVLLLVLWSSLGHMAVQRTKYLGEGSCACAMGLLSGFLLLIVRRATNIDQEALRQLLTFNPADFFTYFLPPIIFYAGLSVKKKKFFRNFGSIATLGILGTYILFAVIALGLLAISKLPNLLNLTDCLALGAIFAATDTVAVLQVIRPEEAGILYSLVFGEGVMNDATSVALLRAVQAYSAANNVTETSMISILWDFGYLFLASLALGMTFGLGIAFMLKLLRFRDSPQEVALIGMLAYLSYLCGELLGISGIVSLFCCGVVTSHYALHNVTTLTRATTVSAFQTLSYISEGCIFIYMGMDTLDPIKWKNTYPSELVWLFVTLLVLLLFGRALYVVPFALLHNMWSPEQLSPRDIVVVWWGGLMRGAVSVALIYRYFDPHGAAALDGHRSTLITTTLLLVLFSTMVLGGLTKPLLDHIQGSAGEPLSHMMELMPHSMRRRQRQGGRGAAGGEGGRQHGGFGSGRYAVVNMTGVDSSNGHSTPDDSRAGVLGGLRSGPSFNDMSDFSLEGSDEGDSPRSYGGHKGEHWWEGRRTPPRQRQRWQDGLGGGGGAARRNGSGYVSPPQVPRRSSGGRAGGRPYAPPVIGEGGGGGATAAADTARQLDAADSGGIVFGRDEGDEVQADPIARDTAALEQMEAAADQQDVARPAAAGQPPLISLAREASAGESPSAIAALWRTFDAQYMQPIFGGPGSLQRNDREAMAELAETAETGPSFPPGSA